MSNHLQNKIVAVTAADTAIGQMICREAALAGAHVHALGQNVDELANTAVGFHKEKLSFRAIFTDYEDQLSVGQAVSNMITHGKAVDIWIHAAPISFENLAKIEFPIFALETILSHFFNRKKGTMCLISSTDNTVSLNRIHKEIENKINLVDYYEQIQRISVKLLSKEDLEEKPTNFIEIINAGQA